MIRRLFLLGSSSIELLHRARSGYSFHSAQVLVGEGIPRWNRHINPGIRNQKMEKHRLRQVLPKILPQKSPPALLIPDPTIHYKSSITI